MTDEGSDVRGIASEGRDPSRSPVRSGGYFPFINSLRGFVIIQIVLLHALFMASSSARSLGLEEPRAGAFEIAYEVLLHGATLYFAVISGMMYSLVFSKRGYLAYLRSRAEHVVLPFVLLTAALSLRSVPLSGSPAGWEVAAGYLASFSRNVFSGQASFHLWYVPVLSVLFLLSPLLHGLLRRTGGLAPALVLMLAPLVVSRNGTTADASTTLYFMGAYVVGLCVGLDPLGAVAWLRTRWVPVAAVAALSTVALAFLYAGGIGDVHGIDVRESVHYVQKLSAFGVLMVAFHRFEATLSRVSLLNACAALAFGIYLLHVPLMKVAVALVSGLVAAGSPLGLLLIVAASLVSGVFGSMLVIDVARRVAGERSKLVVGC